MDSAATALLAVESSVVADLRARGFQTRVDFGQHFLRSPEVATQLLALAGLHGGDAVLEVGAGLGTLSATVAQAGHRIWAIEKDPRMAEVLCTSLGPYRDRARPIMADVREVNLDDELPVGTVFLSILPFEWTLAFGIAAHVFASTSKVARGLAVVPTVTADHTAAGAWFGAGLRVEEVDGISRHDFWPEATVPLRVVSITRC
ncbi:rRNA adenine N-6-methyltransferase family protein [Kitasatospora sp. NPDC059795]|uniref:rRNA adenine N-6-methyltransferase family protein n=1 Tax=Kitasatospora sp. NPDC059795 TaxID=3346949 RepID=UPI00364D5AE1